MTRRRGLDRSLPEQYASFAYGAVKGDLGISIKSKLPVTAEIAERLPFTIGLAITAYLIAIGIGVPAGMIAAIYRHGWPDQFVMILAIAGASIANFWLALMAMNTFSVQLGWLPLLGAASWKSFILPSITLAVLPTAVIARMTRSSMIEVMQSPYVTAARAKGLPERVVVLRHALRNALLPTITVLALDFGRLLGGIVVVETIFAYPGLGRLVIFSIQNRDIPTLQAAILVVAAIYAFANLVADLLYAVLNPKIRFGRDAA